jgi:lipopolysaccharide/colanic/teichoic acid biosynthesis glycosyltransferase
VLKRLWRRRKTLLPPSGEAKRRQIEATEQLALALYRERARSDRNRTAFCMIAITLPKRNYVNLEGTTCDILTSRLRITDEFGWLPDGRIGVVLSETPYAGAVKVLRALEERLYLEATGWDFAIYVYPQTENDEDSDDGQGPDGPEPQRLEGLFVKHLPAWKRIADIVGAGAGLLLLSPVMLFSAALVRISSPGPILFTQLRHSVGGRPFRIYKFRTMRVGADAEKAKLRARSEQDGPAFKLKHDPRVTRVGKLLRVTSLDELPQLLNVLRGEMTLVGPRPLPCDESAACHRWQRSRLDVTPGLTCIWQVSGRSTVTFDDWMRMDLYYIRHRSPWLDAKLVVRTFGAVFRLTGR